MTDLSQSTNQVAVRLAQLSRSQRTSLAAAMGNFLDAAATATARATFYNTQAEQRQATEAVHRELFERERGLYAAALLLPGVTDFSRQLGVAQLLRSAYAESVLLPQQETAAVQALLTSLPPQRMIKLFGELRVQRVNNARTRRLILSLLLGAGNLEFWAVKYRRKLATALIHAWGRRTASVLRAVLTKPREVRSDLERQWVQRHVDRFVGDGDAHRVEQCVRFILGDEDGLTLRRLAAYRDAKRNFASGAVLPPETMEGLRGRYHADKTSADVLALTRSQLTSGQRLAVQRKAAESQVEVEFDPRHYDAVRLYVYAYEMGMSGAIHTELLRKAQASAARLPLRFARVGILLDASASMVGHETQSRRPIATALALRDMLACTAERADIITSDGRASTLGELIQPEGDTSLAAGLVSLLKAQPDAVFVLTDGYENAPSGRFAQVVQAVRQLGIKTPIQQFSPVFAAEAGGIRSLCSEVPGTPVSQPDAIGLGLLKVLFEADLDRGAAALLAVAASALQDSSGEGKRISRPQEVKHAIS